MERVFIKFEFEKLTQKNAIIIADKWKYEGEYSFYNMTEDIEDYEEFIDEESRNKNECFQAILDNELSGYFCLTRNGEIIEIGLGLKPDLCGKNKGLGKEFVMQLVNFVYKNFEFDKLILNVAFFNKRAIKVYHSCGFRDVEIFNQKSNGGIYPFLRMEKIK